MNKKTIDFYNTNAHDYAKSTFNLDLNQEYINFIKDLPLNGNILDAGCGSGRDLLAFKNLGYNVQGIDASEELVKIAIKNSGALVECKTFLDIDWQDKFDGIWCMASLLHLNKKELNNALEKLGNAMKPNAKFYASFKLGEGEGYDNKGRFFSYMNKQEIMEVFQSAGMFKNISILSDNNDKLGRQDTQWLKVFAISNKPQLSVKFRA